MRVKGEGIYKYLQASLTNVSTHLSETVNVIDDIGYEMDTKSDK